MIRSVSMLFPRSGTAVPVVKSIMLVLIIVSKQSSVQPSILRTSVTSPEIAAAATIAGLINSVRPVGLPCRPLKLRLDDEAQTSCPSSRSGFIARHMEHPAPRHSNPASMKVWSSPSRSAAKRTLFEPGTTSAFTEPETLWPCTT